MIGLKAEPNWDVTFASKNDATDSICWNLVTLNDYFLNEPLPASFNLFKFF